MEIFLYEQSHHQTLITYNFLDALLELLGLGLGDLGNHLLEHKAGYLHHSPVASYLKKKIIIKKGEKIQIAWTEIDKLPSHSYTNLLIEIEYDMKIILEQVFGSKII